MTFDSVTLLTENGNLLCQFVLQVHWYSRFGFEGMPKTRNGKRNITKEVNRKQTIP